MTKIISLSFERGFGVKYSEINKTIEFNSILRQLIDFLVRGDLNKY